MKIIKLCLSIELVGYSLVQQGNPGALNPDSIIYYVHDIVLDYLKDTIPKEKQVAISLTNQPLLLRKGESVWCMELLPLVSLECKWHH